MSGDTDTQAEHQTSVSAQASAHPSFGAKAPVLVQGGENDTLKRTVLAQAQSSRLLLQQEADPVPDTAMIDTNQRGSPTLHLIQALAPPSSATPPTKVSTS